MTTPRTQDHLTSELEALGRQFGRDKEHNARRVLIGFVRWLRTTGHGDFTMSAIDHKVSPKVRVDSVMVVDDTEP